jgi:hypothetical protein
VELADGLLARLALGAAGPAQRTVLHVEDNPVNVKLIERKRGERIDLSRIPLDDQDVYASIQGADTVGETTGNPVRSTRATTLFGFAGFGRYSRPSSSRRGAFAGSACAAAVWGNDPSGARR